MHPVVAKFLADRGTHLAAMIAYFALLSFVPLLFLALTLLALAGEQDEQSYLIGELQRVFPESSVDRLIDAVKAIQGRALELGVAGAVGLAWGTLGFFSVLESAFNIVYGLPNRSFIRQKGLVLGMVAASLVVLFVALVVGSVGVELLQRAGVVGEVLAYAFAIALSTALVFGFVWSSYRVLTNVSLTWRETLPGAVLAAVVLEGSFQALPLFVRGTSDLLSLQAFGGLVLLLFWLYVMASILVLGAEVNWWLARGRVRAKEGALGLA